MGVIQRACSSRLTPGEGVLHLTGDVSSRIALPRILLVLRNQDPCEGAVNLPVAHASLVLAS